MLIWQVGIRAESMSPKRVRPDQLPPERSLPVMLAGAIGRIIDRGVASGEFVVSDGVLLSQFIKPGTMSVTPYNHYSSLASWESLLGLPRLADAATVPSVFGADVFSAGK